MRIKSISLIMKLLSTCMAAACSSTLLAAGFSNLSVLNSAGALIGGTNDLAAVWDGTLNTQADIVNDSLHENMRIKSVTPTPFFGFLALMHDVHVFGPGTYSFDTCPGILVDSGTALGYVTADGSTNCDPGGNNNLSMTVGPDQLGAHLWIDWNQSQNIDVVVVWDRNGSFPPDSLASYPVPPDNLWDLVSVDADGDGIPGIPMVDGPFTGFSWNLNLNIPPVPVGLEVQPRHHFKRISQMSMHPVPVAIISRAALDATRVNPNTLIVSDPTNQIHGSTQDFLCRDKDINHDGRLDLVCAVEMTEVGQPGSLVLQLDANTYEGIRIHGEDSVLVVP